MSDFQSENEGSIPFICSNILERFGNPAGLISLSKWVRLLPPELTKFYDMEDMITRCRVVVPDKIYYVITQFVKQYLEVDMYESRDKNGKYGGFDFSKFETKDALDFKEVYEGIAMEYIRPVFVA